jgi:hypothetical protein
MITSLRRLRPRFRLRTLLVLVTVVAVYFALGSNWVYQRRAFMAEQQAFKVRLATDAYWTIRWRCELPKGEPRTARVMRYLYGEERIDEPVQVIFVPGDDAPARLAAANRQAIDWAKQMFPEAEKLTVEFAYPKGAKVAESQTAHASLGDRILP